MVLGGSWGIFVVILLGCSGIACTALMRWAWRQRQLVLARQDSDPGELPAPAAFVLGQTPFVGVRLDVTTEVRHVLETLAPEAARHLVQLEIAVAPDISLHADRAAMRALLTLLAHHAIRQAGGRVLLCAAMLGGRMQIAVTDDGAGPELAVQQAMLRPAAELVALQGGTLEIQAQAGEGTTVVVRLPEASASGRAAEEVAPRRAGTRAVAAEGHAMVAEASWDI